MRFHCAAAAATVQARQAIITLNLDLAQQAAIQRRDHIFRFIGSLLFLGNHSAETDDHVLRRRFQGLQI